MALSFLSRAEVKSFLMRFFFIFIGVELLLYAFPPLPYQEWLASSLGTAFHLPFHFIWVSLTNGQFEITPSCTGLTSASLFLGLIWGFHSIPRKKIGVSILGIFFILVLNYFRLFIVVGAGRTHGLGVAEILHVLSWFILSGIAFGMWLHILRRETGEKDWRKIGKALMKSASPK